jgi:hypothetical protein
MREEVACRLQEGVPPCSSGMAKKETLRKKLRPADIVDRGMGWPLPTEGRSLMQQWHGGKESSPGIFRYRKAVNHRRILRPPECGRARKTTMACGTEMLTGYHTWGNREERRTAWKDVALDTDLIWEAEERPAKSHMRFSGGRSQRKQSGCPADICKLGFGECGEVDHLQNVTRSCTRNKNRKCGSSGFSMSDNSYTLLQNNNWFIRIRQFFEIWSRLWTRVESGKSKIEGSFCICAVRDVRPPRMPEWHKRSSFLFKTRPSWWRYVNFNRVTEVWNYFDKNCRSFGRNSLPTPGIDFEDIFTSKIVRGISIIAPKLLIRDITYCF